jgi:hypothetical protein
LFCMGTAICVLKIILSKQLDAPPSSRFTRLSAFAFIQSFGAESYLHVGTTFVVGPFLINNSSTRSAGHTRILKLLCNHCFAHLCQSAVGRSTLPVQNIYATRNELTALNPTLFLHNGSCTQRQSKLCAAHSTNNICYNEKALKSTNQR